ncbi:hypothetical protein ES703_48212 [subsurface metagenome]
MEYVSWGLIVVWFFLLAVGRAWKEPYLTISGSIVGFVLAIEILENSFLFTLALILINAYILWTTLTAEV